MNFKTNLVFQESANTALFSLRTVSTISTQWVLEQLNMYSERVRNSIRNFRAQVTGFSIRPNYHLDYGRENRHNTMFFLPLQGNDCEPNERLRSLHRIRLFPGSQVEEVQRFTSKPSRFLCTVPNSGIPTKKELEPGRLV